MPKQMPMIVSKNRNILYKKHKCLLRIKPLEKRVFQKIFWIQQ